MSTIERPQTGALPPLVAGQHLDQPTFHARYESMPSGTWAELVDGVVYMPSPLFDGHGRIEHAVAYWLVYYERFTPGLISAANVSTILDNHGEVQPDSQLRIPHELSGHARIVGGYVVGPPELIVEVSRSSRFYDLGVKKDDYERAGVLEYIVAALDPDELFWFSLSEGRYVRLEPDAQGWYRSNVFPGLWLDSKALFQRDYDQLTKVLEQGLATLEHAAFAAKIAPAHKPE